MKKTERSKTETEYKLFKLFIKIFIFIVVLATVVLCVFMLSAKSGELQLLSGLLIMVVVAAIIFVVPRIEKKLKSYLLTHQKDKNAYTGLFKEIYQAYRSNEFAGNLFFDKYQFAEYCNDFIDVSIIKGGHEINIEIDEYSVYLIADEESDQPVETEVKLADIASMDQFYSVINDFIREHSV